MAATNLDLDTSVLADFLYALNIARRQIYAYPPGHPMIAAAAEKLLALLPKLLEFRNEVTIGIARNTLMIEGQQLDASNPVFRDLATTLFDSKVASLTVRRNVTSDEVRRFFELLRYPPERIADAGGLERLLSSSGISGIQAQGIDYRNFHATEVDSLSAPKAQVAEVESAVLWKAFTTGLLAGTLDRDGVRALPDERFDPSVLAEVMNREYALQKETFAGSYDQAITEFLTQADRRQLNLEARKETFGRLGQLVERLSPELRRRFLNSTLKNFSSRPDRAGEILSLWSQSTIVEALEQVDAHQLQIPQALLDVMGKLAAHRKPSVTPSHVAGTRERTTEQTTELLNKLFRADASGCFVPADYRDALAVMASADVATNLDPAQVQELLETLNGHTVERQFCSVLLDLIDRDVGSRSAVAISRNLEELISYFLETGDFLSLNSVHDHLARHVRQTRRLFDTPDKSALAAFAREEFVIQVLDGLDEWGKEQYPAIRGLIGRVGRPFVDQLLDRLAEEPIMSRRRLYMDCLQQLGPQAFDAIAERLHDPRWYVVRNLVILLREINDPGALQPLGRLVGYANPKVQYEVMRTYLHFNDPRADRYLLRELEQRDVGILVATIRLAAGSRNPDVARRLAELLGSRGSSEPELTLKETIIRTLAEMGRPEALPGLAAFIEARSLFMPAALTRLKVEAVSSLVRYADPSAADLAEYLYRKSSGEVARAAGHVCLQLLGKLP